MLVTTKRLLTTVGKFVTGGQLVAPTTRVLVASSPKPAAAVAQAVSTMAPKQKKLSYKEQRELEELPALIAKLEDEQKAISGQLNDPDLYKKKPDEIKRLNERFAALDAQLLESLEKWEAIEARSQG